MLLKSLELQGFKTFPEKTSLSFDNGLTVVVGPNGSGKSNVSDAIRWVLGEQSTKVLRCIKMEDVIFNGTVNKRPKGFAEVTLTIDNSKKSLPFDSDVVAVSRRYYRSGESEYIINGQCVRLKDVNELFMDTGLGRDGYSVISQGKIDSIVALKSNERREMFEEAAGISKYRYRKSEAENKLLKSEENILRLNDILKELEDRIGPLYEQAKKAKDYNILVDKLKSLQIGIWLSLLENFNVKLKDQSDKLLNASNQYNELENEIGDIIKRTESILLDIRNKTLQIDQKRIDIKNFEEKSLLKSSEISVLKNDISHNKENISRLDNDAKKIIDLFSNIDNRILLKKDEIKKLNNIYKTVDTELRNFKDSLNELNDSLNKFGISENEENLKYNDINNKISSEKLKALTAKTYLDDFESRYNETLEKIKFVKTNVEKENFEYESLNKKCTDLENNIQVYFKNIEINKEKLCKIEESYATLKFENDRLNLDYEEQIRKMRFLEELERNLEGFSQGVKFTVKEGKKGNLKGICGPVSSIINVPKKFIVAIETALGAAAQNIVVEKELDAKEAINLLKIKNVGRATFLPVSTINGKNLDISDALLEKGAINLASKICSCSEKYQKILIYLLGKVLIVDSLDNAIKISKNFSYKFKIVTLDGQVINSGGSLTGGTKLKSFGLLDRSNQIKELKNLTDNLKMDLQKSKEQLRNALLDKEDLINEIKNQENLLKNLNDEKFDLKASLKNTELKLATLKESLLSQYKLKSDISLKISDYKENIKVYNKNLEMFISQLNSSKEKLEKFKVEKSDLDLKINSLSENINKKNLELISLKKDIENEQKYLSDIENQKLTAKDNIDNIKSEISNLETANFSIDERINSIYLDIENLKKSINNSYSEIDQLNTERMANEKESTELRSLEREKNSEKEKISLEVSRLRDKKDNLQKGYDEIISRLWDEYELTRREALNLFSKVENTPQSMKTLNEIKIKIKALGNVNISAIDEYKDVSGRYEFLKSQLDDIEKSKKELYKLINDLTFKMRELFEERFSKINKNFNEVFKDLFGGGKAELKLSDPNDVLNSGIEIFVQPPGKIVTHLESLSGGEKAFISIALYFAIMKVNPVPFCVLDEIEAALDEVNVSRFASYLKKINKDTQFIVVSHRRGTMEEADVIYGVTMQEEGISKILKLNIGEYRENFLEDIN